MISSLDARNEWFLQNLISINSRLERAQREVASGKRLVVGSDEPDSVPALMQTKTDLVRLSQTTTNLGRLKTEVDAGELALQESIKLFDRVRTLGQTGASGVQNASTRKGIAEEIGSILQRMVGLANTQVDGRFIFSGDSDQTPAFTFDLNQNPPWSPYQGTAATRQALHPTGVTFPVAVDASTIFTNADPAINVFQAIENLRQALLSNDEPAMQAALAPLSDMTVQLNSVLTTYGNIQTQLVEATDTTEKFKLRLESEKANLEDADVTKSILELQQLKYTQQAALEVKAKLPRTSLFDFLG
jgi:flagellar hook-associated protein 3 FlgL